MRERLRKWWKAPRAPRTNRQRGVAMLIVITWLALMISVIGEFTYGTTVDAAQAANARDELRAHYLARSSVNLARLLIKIQQQYIDPIMGQLQKMLTQATGSGTNGTGRQQRGGDREQPGFGAVAGVQPARHRLRQHADGVLQPVRRKRSPAWGA